MVKVKKFKILISHMLWRIIHESITVTRSLSSKKSNGFRNSVEIGLQPIESSSRVLFERFFLEAI